MSEDSLTQLALGEAPTPPAAEHLRTCPACARELDSLRHVVLAIRVPEPDEGELTQPPADVWDSIAAELHLDPLTFDPPASGTPADSSAADADGPGARRSDPPAVADRAAAPGQRARRPKGLRGRRMSRLSVALAACAALLGAAAGSGVTWWAVQDDRTATAQPSEEGARLDSLRPQSAGYALVSGTDGHRKLDITVKGLPKTAGYFEVWLMDRDHKKLISMGSLGPDGHAVLPLPPNVDLSEYAVVDVSVQPFNGRPDHSGDSIVRGPYAG